MILEAKTNDGKRVIIDHELLQVRFVDIPGILSFVQSDELVEWVEKNVPKEEVKA